MISPIKHHPILGDDYDKDFDECSVDLGVQDECDGYDEDDEDLGIIIGGIDDGGGSLLGREEATDDVTPEVNDIVLNTQDFDEIHEFAELDDSVVLPPSSSSSTCFVLAIFKNTISIKESRQKD